LGRRGHWLDMLGREEGEVNESKGFAVFERILVVTSPL